MTYNADERIQKLDERINNNLEAAQHRSNSDFVAEPGKRHHTANTPRRAHVRFQIAYWIGCLYGNKVVCVGPFRDKREADQQCYEMDNNATTFELTTVDKSKAQKIIQAKMRGGEVEPSEYF